MALWAVFLAAPATTHAYTPTSEEATAIEQWLSKGGLPSGSQLPCGTVCDDLWLAEHRPLPNQPSSQQLYREIFAARQRAGLLPPWAATGGRVIGAVALGAGAAWVGWQIGTGINSLFLGVASPGSLNGDPPDPGGITHAVYLPAGDELMGNGPVLMPYDGWVAHTDSGIWADSWVTSDPGSESTSPPCEATQHDPPTGPGGGWSMIEGVEVSNTVNCSPPDLSSTEYRAISPLYAPGSVTGSSLGFGSYSREWADQDEDAAGMIQGDPITEWNDQIPDWAVGLSVEDRIFGHWEDFPLLNEWLGHELDPEDNPDDPIVGTIPDCQTLSYNACITALQAAGYGVTHRTRETDWHDMLPRPQYGPDTVLSTFPIAGTAASLSTDVAVHTNPVDGLPVVIPQIEDRGQEEYGSALNSLGLSVTYNSAPEYDPDLGDGTITQVEPAPGETVQNGSTVTVEYNDPNSVGGGGGSPCDDANIRAFDLTPLQVGIGNVFPFGVFGWLSDTMGDWVTSPVAPVFHLKINDDIDWDVSLAALQPVLDYARPAMLIVSCLGMVWLLAASAMRINQPPDD